MSPFIACRQVTVAFPRTLSPFSTTLPRVSAKVGKLRPVEAGGTGRLALPGWAHTRGLR
jgi:hypothetical protein